MIRLFDTSVRRHSSAFFHLSAKRYAAVALFLLMALHVSAEGDSIASRKPFFKKMGAELYRFVKSFNTIDTNYIEPQHYNYTAMLQNTNSYEQYRISSKKGQSIAFAPDPSYKLGPYLGWRWIFLGYTLDVKNLTKAKNKTELGLSLYSSLIGIDLFYRKTGNDYKVKNIDLGEHIDTSPMDGTSFDGFNASIKGFNIYYIFNHKKFSYPAAFSQSTCQKRSCGSALLGIGYTKHSLEVDWDKLDGLLYDKLGKHTNSAEIDPSLLIGKVKYTDISVSGGYAYNWVLARNLLFSTSLSLAVGYKHTVGNMGDDGVEAKGFSFRNLNIDGIGRFGLVWNNTKWYAGASSIIHSYNYSKSQFSANSFFGSLNIYVGINFGRR